MAPYPESLSGTARIEQHKADLVRLGDSLAQHIAELIRFRKALVAGGHDQAAAQTQLDIDRMCRRNLV